MSGQSRYTKHQQEFLESAESIAHLEECQNLRTLDLTNNKLPADENVMETLKSIPRLATLSINGNEVTKLPAYRKRMIFNIPTLGYLDRPIDEVEKLCAAAFNEGGPEAEQKARADYRDALAQKRKDELRQFKEWHEAEREKRKNMSDEKKHEIATIEEEKRRLREIEANKDAALEAKALELGVSKLALHMMRGDGSLGDFYEAQKAAVEANEKATPPGLRSYLRCPPQILTLLLTAFPRLKPQPKNKWSWGLRRPPKKLRRERPQWHRKKQRGQK